MKNLNYIKNGLVEAVGESDKLQAAVKASMYEIIVLLSEMPDGIDPNDSRQIEAIALIAEGNKLLESAADCATKGIKAAKLSFAGASLIIGNIEAAKN